MLSKLFLVILMSFVFISPTKAGDRRDGPFPMFSAEGVWLDSEGALKVEIVNGMLSGDQLFMPVTIKVYAADGTISAQGSGLHPILDSNLLVNLRDQKGRKMVLRLTAYYGEEEHPLPNNKYQLVMSLGYVYEKVKSVKLLRR